MEDEVCWKIYVDFFFVSGLFGSFYDCIVRGRRDILVVVLQVEGYSFSILTWKYCAGCFVVYFCDLVLGLLARGDSGEGRSVSGGVACFTRDDG